MHYIIGKNINFHDLIIKTFTALFFLALIIFISYFGLPLTDESFPIAISMRFIQGQKPFVDDFSPYISLGLLLSPLVKLSLLIHNGKNELILFLRHSYILVNVLLGGYVFFSTKKYLPSMAAFFIGIFVLSFHAFGINNFHYDTLGMTLWTVILFQLFNFLFQENNKPQEYILFSFLNLALCLSYPTFAFLLFFLYLGCSFFLQEKKPFWFSHLLTITFASIFMAGLFFYYFQIQLSDINNALQFNKNLLTISSHGHTTLGKITSIFEQLVITYGKFIVLICLLATIVLRLQKTRWLVPIFFGVVLIAPIFNIDLMNSEFIATFYFFNCIGFSGAIIYWFFLRHNDLAKKLFYSIWIPAFFGGILTSTTSYNLELNFALGFSPASILGFIFAYLAAEKPCAFCKINTLPSYFITRGILLYGFIMLAFFQVNFIYGETKRGINIYKNVTKFIIPGPFQGLYLNSFENEVLTSLQKDIAAIDTDPNKFVYFGPFSSGYLLVEQLKPGEHLLCIPYTIDHFGREVKLPNYTFDLSRALNLPKDDIKTYLARDNYKKISSTQYYDIYYGEGAREN